MLLGQGRHLYRIVDDESRLNKGTFACLAENLVYQLTHTHRRRNLNAASLCNIAHLVFRQTVQVITRPLLYSIQYGQTAVGSLEINLIIAYLHLRGTVRLERNLLQQSLGKIHHPVVILVCHVELHAGKLGIVVAVHTLVAKILPYLIDPLETAHNKTLQIELGSYAAIESHIQRVMVRNKGTGIGASGNRLQYGCLNLCVAGLIEHRAQGTYHLCALQECLLHPLVHHQVNATPAVTLVGVIEPVIDHPVLVLYNRQRTQ